jgi:hypothetical protein
MSFSGSFERASEALQKAGFYLSLNDQRYNPLHPFGYQFRNSGDPGTGRHSTHIIIFKLNIPGLPPTLGNLHAGETNPDINRWEHIVRDFIGIGWKP